MRRTDGKLIYINLPPNRFSQTLVDRLAQEMSELPSKHTQDRLAHYKKRTPLHKPNLVGNLTQEISELTQNAQASG